jgi:uncharacterized cupredoxin-like copper-binding protein
MKILQTLCLAAGLSGAAVALAHGEAHGGAKGRQPATVVKVQKDWGIAGDSQSVRRTVRFTMSDAMRFTPDTLVVKRGETLRIVVKNAGKARHEFVLGSRAELEAHAAMMQKFPDMAHDEPYMAHVAPGQTGSIVWTFNRAGDFDFGCLVPGHLQAGMAGRIRVEAR